MKDKLELLAKACLLASVTLEAAALAADDADLPGTAQEIRSKRNGMISGAKAIARVAETL